jgi:hypothetical protein
LARSNTNICGKVFWEGVWGTHSGVYINQHLLANLTLENTQALTLKCRMALFQKSPSPEKLLRTHVAGAVFDAGGDFVLGVIEQAQGLFGLGGKLLGVGLGD